MVMAAIGRKGNTFTRGRRCEGRDELSCRVGKANGSRECAPDDKLRVPTTAPQWWARRKGAFARPTS